MSPLILTTDPDSPYSVELGGVGTLGGSGRGGIPVERAAQTAVELQDEDGKPLSGKKLEDAARGLAEARGLRVRSVKTLDEEALRVEAGAFPSGPTIEELAAAAAERERAQVVAHAETEQSAALVPEDLPPQVNPEPPATAGKED